MVDFENGVTPINDVNLNKMQKDILQSVFPVGATYITQDADTNPSTILGFGTWERFKGKVALGVDEDDTNLNEIGKTGGEKTHTLTVEEMPSHRHAINTNINSSRFGTDNSLTRGYQGTNEIKDEETYMKSTGGGQAHNNMPPYETVGYMWIRRA